MSTLGAKNPVKTNLRVVCNGIPGELNLTSDPYQVACHCETCAVASTKSTKSLCQFDVHAGARQKNWKKSVFLSADEDPNPTKLSDWLGPNRYLYDTSAEPQTPPPTGPQSSNTENPKTPLSHSNSSAHTQPHTQPDIAAGHQRPPVPPPRAQQTPANPAANTEPLNLPPKQPNAQQQQQQQQQHQKQSSTPREHGAGEEGKARKRHADETPEKSSHKKAKHATASQASTLETKVKETKVAKPHDGSGKQRGEIHNSKPHPDSRGAPSKVKTSPAVQSQQDSKGKQQHAGASTSLGQRQQQAPAPTDPPAHTSAGVPETAVAEILMHAESLRRCKSRCRELEVHLKAAEATAAEKLEEHLKAAEATAAEKVVQAQAVADGLMLEIAAQQDALQQLERERIERAAYITRLQRRWEARETAVQEMQRESSAVLQRLERECAQKDAALAALRGAKEAAEQLLDQERAEKQTALKQLQDMYTAVQELKAADDAEP